MVMYYLGMKYLVQPVARWQDRREEKLAIERGIAIGRKNVDRKWRAWYERLQDAVRRGEPFTEPPPDPPFVPPPY